MIARPFRGETGHYTRTSNRHDFALLPPESTLLDVVLDSGMSVKAVGKIRDIYAGRGVSDYVLTQGNMDGIDKTLKYMAEVFSGFIMTNLIDFDMLYGHRNDVEGYAKALEEFDARLPELLAALKADDILVITADHGCDPTTAGTDHSREYVPLILTGSNIKKGVHVGTRASFADLGTTLAEYLGVDPLKNGKSFLPQIRFY